jgi:hypothetical protein
MINPEIEPPGEIKPLIEQFLRERGLELLVADLYNVVKVRDLIERK